MKWRNIMALPTMKNGSWLLYVLILLVLIPLMSVMAGCQQKVATHPTTHYRPPENGALYIYKVHQQDDSWLYYYVLYMAVSNYTRTYYATSPALVSDYRSLTFTRSPVSNLPQEIDAKVSGGDSKLLDTRSVGENALPSDAKADLEAACTEYEQTQNAVGNEHDASENPAPPEEQIISQSAESTPQEAETGSAPNEVSSSDTGGSSDPGGSGSTD